MERSRRMLRSLCRNASPSSLASLPASSLLVAWIQSGLARSGKMLACDWEGIRPDVVILGKALGGGVITVSAVLADKDVMLCFRPGEHGSTFGGNPLASAVAIASLDVIHEEKLAERSAYLGQEFRKQLLEGLN